MSHQDLRDEGFSGEILLPGSLIFNDASRRYSALAERVARFIVLPKSTQDVSIAILFSRKYVWQS